MPVVADTAFDQLVRAHYAPLFRFALSLAREEGAAADLVQQTFYLWATKGSQLREPRAARSWLLTTLHREFLRDCRQAQRFAHVEVTTADEKEELPHITPEVVDQMDGRAVMQALMKVDEIFRAPLALYYLEEMTYQEIAETLEVPTGTVMSRLARGKGQLRHLLCVEEDERRQKVMALRPRVADKERVHG